MKNKKRIAWVILFALVSIIAFFILITVSVINPIGTFTKEFAREALIYTAIGWGMASGIRRLTVFLAKGI